MVPAMSIGQILAPSPLKYNTHGATEYTPKQHRHTETTENLPQLIMPATLRVQPLYIAKRANTRDTQLAPQVPV